MSSSITVGELYDQVRDGRIISDIELQREIIYDDEKQALVIDSIVKGIPLPAFYFWKNSNGVLDLTSPSAKDVDGFWTWIRQTALSQVVPGSKTAELNMTQKAMSDMSRCQNVGGCIAALKNEHLVTTLGRGKYEVCLNKDRVQGISPFELIRKDKIDKLNQVVSFYQSKDCRASYLCGYFGDITFDGACGGCDNCTR